MIRTHLVTSFALLSLVSLAAPLTAQEKKPGYGKATDAKASGLVTAIEEAWSQGQWADVSASAEKLVKLEPKNGRAWYQLGYALHAQQKWDGALAAHMKAAHLATDSRIRQPATYNVACVHAIRKEKDKAFEWLGKALEVGFSQVGTLKSDPDMDNLRDDPRFGKLLERAAKAAADAPQRVFTSVGARQQARVLYFGNSGSGGQVSIDFGAVPWNDKYAGVLDNEKFVGKRWRLGSNFWTNLDTNVALTLGGKSIAAGQYYLVLTHQGDKKFALTLLDPADVRKSRIDASGAANTTGGIDVPMYHSTDEDDFADRLRISCKMKDDPNTKGKLVIQFGPHVLTAPLEVKIVK